MQSLKKIHAWAQMKVPLYTFYTLKVYNFFFILYLLFYVMMMLFYLYMSRKYRDFLFYFISLHLFTLITHMCVYFLPLYIIYHIYGT